MNEWMNEWMNESVKIFPSTASRNICPVQHMSQNFLSVFQPLSHLRILAIKRSSQWILTSLSLQVNVGDQFLLTWQNNFSLVSKINLNNFVTQLEYDCMFGFHPSLNIAISIISLIFIKTLQNVRTKIILNVITVHPLIYFWTLNETIRSWNGSWNYVFLNIVRIV